MHRHGKELYREFTGWSYWVYSIMWGSIGGAAIASAAAGSEWAAYLCVGSAVVIHVVLGGLLVTLEPEGLRVGLGRVRLLRTFIPFSNIRSLESVSYRPLREFGGWGIRGSRKRRVWSARGTEAVVLWTHDGRQIYIGSDEPHRLEGRIRNSMSVGGFGLDE